MPIAEHRDNGSAVTEPGTAEAQPRGLWTQGAGGRPSQPLRQLQRTYRLTPACTLRLSFAVPDGGAGAYARIELAPDTAPVTSFQVRLTCYPGGFGPAHGQPLHRWVLTAKGETGVPKDFVQTADNPFPVLPLPAGENWVFYADKLQSRGSLGLVLLPEERAAGEIRLSSYGVSTVLTCPPNARTVHLGFLAFDTANAAAQQAFVASVAQEQADIPKSLPHRARLRGPVDHRVPVIAVRSPAGGLLAVVFAYSCHPVMTPESVWSGDFPGFAMLDLEHAHPQAMALFCQGCGGDQNCVRGPIALAREQGRLLATAVEEALAKPMTGIEPRLATTGVDIMLDYERVVTRQELEAVLQAEDTRTSAKARWARQMLAELKDRGRLSTGYSYPMQAWKLGTKTLWVALSGEPLVDYALTLQKKFGPDTLVTGYCSDLMAYIPSRRIWEEARGEEVMYLWEYGRPAYRWAGDVEPRILAAVEQMVRTLEDQIRGRESSVER